VLVVVVVVVVVTTQFNSCCCKVGQTVGMPRSCWTPPIHKLYRVGLSVPNPGCLTTTCGHGTISVEGAKVTQKHSNTLADIAVAQTSSG